LALNFNVSHSGGLALIEFTTFGEGAIDVEAIRCNVEALDITSARFTRTEAVMIALAPTHQGQANTFLHF
jgi:phosphopantetheinyl transferase